MSLGPPSLGIRKTIVIPFEVAYAHEPLPPGQCGTKFLPEGSGFYRHKDGTSGKLAGSIDTDDTWVMKVWKETSAIRTLAQLTKATTLVGVIDAVTSVDFKFRWTGIRYEIKENTLTVTPSLPPQHKKKDGVDSTCYNVTIGFDYRVSANAEMKLRGALGKKKTRPWEPIDARSYLGGKRYTMETELCVPCGCEEVEEVEE